jgi:uncharacterized RDD family membrane protein YckC
MDQPMNQPPNQPVRPIVQPPPMSPSPHPTYAGFWKRFAAIFIDKIIIGIATLIILIPMFLVIGVSAFSSENYEPSIGFIIGLISAYMIFILIAWIAEWLYFAMMESVKGATIGKMALGIKVTDMNGQMPTFGRASGRYFGKILSSLTFGVGYLIAGFSQQKQALHDILAKTLVVNKY